jgi:hypothetical protein
MTESTKQKTQPVINQSNENGENIGRDKIENIYQDIAPKSLHAPIEKILNFVKNKEIDNALLLLDTLKSMGNLDSEALALLDIISVRINLMKQTEIDDAYQTLTNFYQNEPAGLAADLCIGTLIRLDVSKEQTIDAKERYQQVTNPGIYSQEAYFELLAEPEALEDSYRTNRLNITETRLCSLVRGGLRLKLFDLTVEMANRLTSCFPSFNSNVLLAVAETAKLSDQLANKHYWFISYNLKSELETLCAKIIRLIDGNNGKDERLFPTAASMLHYMMGQPKELNQLCLKYIDIVAKVSPEVAKIITLPEHHELDLDDEAQRLVKAYDDKEYRQNLLNEIFQKNTITTGDAHALLSISDHVAVDNWLNNGGNIVGDNQLEIDYYMLSLKAQACTPDLRNSLSVEVEFNKFLEKHPNHTDQMQPLAINQLASKLFNIDLFISAAELLKPYINEQDPWPSPPIKCYINSLIEGQQNHTLEQLLNNMNIDTWDDYLWQVKASRLAVNKKYRESIQAYEEALLLSPNHIHIWLNALHVHKLHKSADKDVLEFIDRVPQSAFAQPTEQASIFLMEWTRLNTFNKAEEVLLNWFIKTPEDSAILITNFYFSLITQRDEKDIKFSTITSNIDGAVRYLENNLVKTKIITTNSETTSPYITQSESPLGQILLNTPVGETKKSGVKTIQIIENICPFQAVLNICTELRETINDGNDCFHSLHLPTNPSEMFEEMKTFMQGLESNKEHITQAENIPLLIKCAKLGSSNPVQTALQAMTTKEYLKHSLPNVGIEIYDELILDVYSIIYLAITGLHKGIAYDDTRIVVTESTKFLFDSWLKDINRDDYLRAGVSSDGDLFRTTSSEIKVQTKDLQAALKKILTSAIVLNENLVDLPPNILKFKNLLCHSVYSTLTLSIANNIPWLCIDGLFSQLYTGLGHTTINATKYLTSIAKNIAFDDKKKGIFLYCIADTPYPLTFEEISELSKSEDENDFYFLAEILNKIPNAFQQSEGATQFAYKLLIPVLNQGYLDGEMLHGSRVDNIKNNGLAERIFNACCRMVIAPKDGKIAEEKLAKLVVALAFTYKGIPTLRKLIFTLFSEFISGHFLDINAVNDYAEKITTEWVNSNSAKQ